jgi:GMP synthase-like glutamine amidotransferase
MRIHYLQHVPFEGPAHLSSVVRPMGAELTHSLLFAGQEPPEPAAFDLLVVLGGPMGVHDEKEHSWLAGEKQYIELVLESGKRIVGICLGAQLVASVLGARVYKNRYKEIGWYPVTKTVEARSSPLGSILPGVFPAFHWHGDTFDIPSGAVHMAESAACANQCFLYEDRALGLQFHLESTADSIRLLHDNCGDELDGGGYVQTSDEILKTGHIAESNLLFERILVEILK